MRHRGFFIMLLDGEVLMQVKIYNKGIYTVAGLSGEIDEYSAPGLREKLDKGLSMDSTGIGVLLGRYKLLKKSGKNMFICNPDAQVDRVLRTIGIYTIMKKVSV